MARIGRAVSIFAASLIVAGCDQSPQPSTYDDCILKHVAGVASDHAAKLIRDACREKFPDTKADTEFELSEAELSKLTGRFGLSGSRYGGRIYNGNDDITVTSITIEVTLTRGDQTISRLYRQQVTIPSLSTSSLALAVFDEMEGVEHSAHIASAVGARRP